MMTILIICIIIVFVVLFLTLLTTNKAYKYEHTIDQLESKHDDNEEEDKEK